MHDLKEQCQSVFHVMLCLFLFFKTIYKMTITRFGFCDIQNNQLEIIGLLRFRQSWTLKNLKV